MAMTWLLVVLLYAADGEPAKRQTFLYPSERLCIEARDYMLLEHREGGSGGGLILWCEGKT
jgi:hypothetical protein